ncbi:MAG: hypothetical protein HYX31_13085 [Mycobacterium sp.]|jgi:hypothetical protein|nr:hypothetical protein [Mycobacterium sp.]
MDAYVTGYRRACQHLLAAGLLPAPCRSELQTLWSLGDRADRELVQKICTQWEMS